MTVPAKCDVCGDEHWPHQAHRFARVAEVALLEVSAGPLKRHPVGVCEGCGHAFERRRSDARFCGARCRQAACRKRGKEK